MPPDKPYSREPTLPVAHHPLPPMGHADVRVSVEHLAKQIATRLVKAYIFQIPGRKGVVAAADLLARTIEETMRDQGVTRI